MFYKQDNPTTPPGGGGSPSDSKNLLILKKGESYESLQFEMVFTNLQEESVTLKQVKESLAFKSGIYAFFRNETHQGVYR